MVSVTCDTWTSPNHKSILGITAHWIDSDWLLRDLAIPVLVVQGDHSGANPGRYMVAIFEEYGLGGKLFCITADNASSNKVMGRYIAASGKIRGLMPSKTFSDAWPMLSTCPRRQESKHLAVPLPMTL